MDEIKFFLDEATEMMAKSIQHTNIELAKIRAGKAMPSMLDGISLEYYGTMTALSQVASITTPDARTIIIKPWEKKTIPNIERAIINSDLGVNPQNDGEIIRINIPPLTEERRRGLVKMAKAEAENGKISIRNIRKETNDLLKKLLKDGASEDEIKRAEDIVQKMTDDNVSQVDELVVKKEAEIMHI
jgi:ribosome recycling factor